MTRQLVKDAMGWGFILWLVGYVLGMVLFPFVPTAMIGWAITPVGILMTVWVVLKKVKGDSLPYYAQVAVVWTILAVALDYVFLVKLLKPADGYYKLDVYLYYALTLAIPVVLGWRKTRVH